MMLGTDTGTFGGASKKAKSIVEVVLEGIESDAKTMLGSLAFFEEARCMHMDFDSTGGVPTASTPQETKLAVARKADAVLKMYKKSVEQGAKFPLPVIGCAQMLVRIEDYSEALRVLKTLLPPSYGGEATPSEEFEHPLVHWLAGSICISIGDEKAAVKHLRVAAENLDGEMGIQLDLGQSLHGRDPPGALAAYEKALGLSSDSTASVPLLNNIAVLIMQLQSDDAERMQYAAGLLDKALSMLQGNSQGSGGDSAREESGDPIGEVTLKFNVALLMEMRGETSKAKDAYEVLLEGMPSHTDARLRLAWIDAQSKNLDAAFHGLETALEHCRPEEKPKVYCFIGEFQLARTDRKFELRLKDAKDAFLKAQELSKREDGGKKLLYYSYATISKSNIYLELTPKREKETSDPNKIEQRREGRRKRDEFLKAAKEGFMRVAKKSSSRSIWAMNGLGCVVAESDESCLPLARQIFERVQEIALGDNTSIPDVDINLAHTYLHDGEFVRAVQLYNNVNKKYYQDKNVDVLKFLGRAYNDSGEYMEMLHVVDRALAVDPDNDELLFNKAYTHQQLWKQGYARAKAMTTGKYPVVKEAVEHLEEALRLFESLKEKENLSKVVSEMVPSHAKYLHDTHNTIQQFLNVSKKAYDVEKVNADARRLQAEAKEAKRLEELKREEEDRAKKQEQKRMLEAEIREDRAKMLQKWADEEKMKQAKAAGEAEPGNEEDFQDLIGREEEGRDDEDEDAADGADHHGEPDHDLAANGPGEEGAPATRRRKRNVIRDDDEIEDEGPDEGRGAAGLVKKPRTEEDDAMRMDDDDDDDEKSRAALLRDMGLDSDDDD